MRDGQFVTWTVKLSLDQVAENLFVIIGVSLNEGFHARTNMVNDLFVLRELEVGNFILRAPFRQIDIRDGLVRETFLVNQIFLCKQPRVWHFAKDSFKDGMTVTVLEYLESVPVPFSNPYNTCKFTCVNIDIGIDTCNNGAEIRFLSI